MAKIARRSSIPFQLEPMEARLISELPSVSGWQFEPKWDGFRCLAFRSGSRVELQAKSGKTLARCLFDADGTNLLGTERSTEWEPLRPELVVEVCYDHVTADRFRHGTRLLRWRPDKAPRQCTFEQLEREARPGKLIARLLSPARKPPPRRR